MKHDAYATYSTTPRRRKAQFRRDPRWPSSWHIHPQQDLVIVSLLAHGDERWLTPREWRRYREEPKAFEFRAAIFRRQLIAEGRVRA